MKTCIGCKHADWKRTTGRKLHPSGEGQCKYPYRLSPLPASRHWVGCFIPIHTGGIINRKEELENHCAYYSGE